MSLSTQWIPVLLAANACMAQAQPVMSPTPPAVACAASRPVVMPGETVNLLTWMPPPARGEKRSATWTARDGKVDAAMATWSFPATLQPSEDGQVVEAMVTVASDGLELGRCTATVLLVGRVASPVSVPERGFLAGRAIIPSGQQPEAGFGLYSYLLLTRPPIDETSRERYAAAIEAFILRILPAEELALYRRRSELNLVIVFVKAKIDTNGDPADKAFIKRVANEIITSYDYARAATLAATIGVEASGGGPYLASGLSVDANAESQVVLDASRVAPKLVTDWVGAFCALTSQPTSWSSILLTKTGLTMRNVLASSASASPDVTASLTNWLKIGKLLSK